jgi:uncharacterized membrane protein YphA (DoxX/SURF4 family)
VSPPTNASPTGSWEGPERWAAAAGLVVVGVLAVCVLVVVIVAGALAMRGRLSPVAFLGLTTTLLAALTPSPLTKLRPGGVQVDNAEQVGPNT